MSKHKYGSWFWPIMAIYGVTGLLGLLGWLWLALLLWTYVD